MKFGSDTITLRPVLTHIHDWRIYELAHNAQGDFYECEMCGERQFRASRDKR